MTKKTIILFLILPILLVSISGCNNKIDVPSENSIPFITFSVNQKANYVEAYLNYWDIGSGKIIMTNKVLYIVTAPPGRTGNPKILDWDGSVHLFGPPLSWDGESYIYLSNNVHKPKNIPSYFKLKMFDDPRVPAKFASGKIVEAYDFMSYSKNLQVQMKNTGDIYSPTNKYSDFTYRVFDDDNNKIIEKNVKISLHNDIFHGGVDTGEACLYEKNSKEVKQLFLYYDSVGMGHFLICTVNLEKGTYEWSEVIGLKGCIPFMNQSEVSIIGNDFYIPLCGGYIGVINPDDFTCETFNPQNIFKSLSFYNAPVYCQEDMPLDEYKNFLILNGSVAYGVNEEGLPPERYKQLWVAYDTKAKEIAQILEWDSLKPQFIVVRSKDGKELSRVETDKLVKDISKLYNVNGESYIKGFFVFGKFIRFPHKNGD